ncbi:glycerophosphodiester phosphodiesterase GDPD1, chloroplastic-like [Salvia splendens]|uniref:glycerophosphodiester phosphodiesterase GDPD1, chloroplastic-like n=1 Tax=Salvia splendens TaxID=180675 RepID=UPI0011028975|nr:glycerophosphodiester phosphodiesterase GDPD1, chloroplastic-like [Salvia splendens]
MALKAIHVSDVPNLDCVPDNASFALYATRFSKGVETERATSFKVPKFLVIGHRGNGMNMLQSADLRMKAVKENTILSFNNAGKHAADYIEFDVQVTKDGYPIIFHDNFICSEENGSIYEKRVTDLSLSEFLTYGPQRELGLEGKPLLRKTKDGKHVNWTVESDEHACTLREAFEKVNPSLGFNIELKFDDYIVYQHQDLTNVLQAILEVVIGHANERPVILSTFQPDAALIIRKLQNTYPVFFLTNGGTEIYEDVRRNSLEEAIQLCLEGGLDGIVSEVKGIFRHPAAVKKIKDHKLSLLTYGKLNNVAEAVYMQHLMGVDGVIVDLVREITEAVSKMMRPSDGKIVMEGEDQVVVEGTKPQFSQRELEFLLKLIPELIQQ